MIEIIDPVIAPFKIVVEEQQYVLVEMRTIGSSAKSLRKITDESRIGQTREVSHGYYTQLPKAIEYIAKQKMIKEYEGAEMSLSEFLSVWSTSVKEITEAIKITV